MQDPDPLLMAAVRDTVGHVGIQQLQLAVRKAMVVEALARSGGNRRAAARLLGVSRQHLQHMLRSLEIALPREAIVRRSRARNEHPVRGGLSGGLSSDLESR